MPFPDLTVTRPGGAHCLFVADEHDKAVHIRILNRNLGLLKTKIGVLYLEHFAHTETNLQGAPLAKVLRLIQANRFEWYPEIADNFTALLAKAAELKLVVNGINFVDPNPIGKFAHMKWRTDGSNDAIATEIKRQVAIHKQNYAIFAGGMHAAGLNKTGRLSGILTAAYKCNPDTQTYVNMT